MATVQITTKTRTPEAAATVALMLIKASLGIGDRPEPAPVVVRREPVLAGGAAVKVRELA